MAGGVPGPGRSVAQLHGGEATLPHIGRIRVQGSLWRDLGLGATGGAACLREQSAKPGSEYLPRNIPTGRPTSHADLVPAAE